MNAKKQTIEFMLFLLLCCLFIGTTSFATYTSNYSEPTIIIKRGTYGTGVKWLQDMLNHNGYSLVIDGEFGNATYNAVTNFQRGKGLVIDGIVGKATKTALKKYANTTEKTDKCMYTSTRVNFRSGPSTAYSSLQVLEANTKITVLSSYNASWSHVLYENTYGYIASQYLKDTMTNALATSSNKLPTFIRNTSSLLTTIQNCKSYYANHNFYYSTANGVRSIPADNSTNYSGKYYVDCSSFVSWVLYEYASSNQNIAMKNYFSYQRNSATFASIGANGGNDFLEVVSSLSLAEPGDILVSPGHVEFYYSHISYSPAYAIIKVYNCGSNASIKNAGLTNSATLNPNDITYILRVK